MSNCSEEGSSGGRRSVSSSPKGESPYSPFPFGSPLTCSTRSVLSPSSSRSASSLSTATSNRLVSKNPLLNRLKGQDLYGGRVMFGGKNNSPYRNRHDRITSSNPYQSIHRRKLGTPAVVQPETSSSTPSTCLRLPEENPSETTVSSKFPSDGLSTTAKLILDTLDRMSTPLRDVHKIPLSHPSSRAEKRRIIAEELDNSLLTPGVTKRKRPNLGHGSVALNGPPLRTLFTPVNSTPKKPLEIPVKSSIPAKEKSPLTNGGLASIASSIEDYKKFAASAMSEPEGSAPGKIRSKVTERGKARAERAQIPKKLPVSDSNASGFSFGFLNKKTDDASSTTNKPLATSNESKILSPSKNPIKVTKIQKENEEIEKEFIFSNPLKIKNYEVVGDNHSSYTFDFSKPLIPDVDSTLLPSITPPLLNGHARNLPDLGISKSSLLSTMNDKNKISFGSNHKLPDVATTAESLKIIPSVGSLDENLKCGTGLWNSEFKNTSKPWS